VRSAREFSELVRLGRREQPGSVMKYAETIVHEQPPNNQFQRSVNSRLRRLLPPAELERWATREMSVGPPS
jgi:hypothetical protein